MLERRAEPCGDQQGAELVAVQRDSMRLIIHTRPPDVGGRTMLEKFFLHGVLIEPGNGAQPPGDGGAGSALCFQLPAKLSMSARRTANKASDRARHQVVNWRRSSA